MFFPTILALLALQASGPSLAGEDSLVWTELPDPDPGYVPPPPSAEELAARRALQAHMARLRKVKTDDRQAAENVDRELRRAEQAVRNAGNAIRDACEGARGAGGGATACNQ